MSDYLGLTGKTIDEAFDEFDRANPQVWARFVEFSLRLIGRGWQSYSSKSIICVMRFERDLETTPNDDGWKINDIMTSRYARKFAEMYPEYGTFFKMRELRARSPQDGMMF